MKKCLVVTTCLLAVLVCGCQGVRTHEGLNATVYVQTAVEFDMACEQAYRLARQSVEAGLQDKDWTAAIEQRGKYQDLPPAVIVDVDETVLDNSPFQARVALADTEYQPDAWEDWEDEAQAQPIPGAKDFIAFAKSKGVTVFYVTNRSQEAPTLVNIQKELDPDVTPQTLMCKNEQEGWGSDKTSRRSAVAGTHRILLLVGDDYNDFAFLGKASPESRKELAADHRERWGKHWIMIPNPNYGNWERSAYGYDYALDRAGKLARKYRQLDPALMTE